MRLTATSVVSLLILLSYILTPTQCKSRKKRYVNFPEGSTFTLAFCMTIKAITFGDADIFTEAVAAAANYDLPNNASIFPVPLPEQTHGILPQKRMLQNKYYAARAHRALMYSKAENILDSVGIDGRACILRTLCETVQLLPTTGNLIHQLLRIIFTIPVQMMEMRESSKHWQYRAAQISGLQYEDCSRLFHRCPMSILNIALSMRPQ